MVEDKREVEREYIFDNIKGILIWLVVFAHFINLELYPYDYLKIAYTFIYFFHMPAFIFISGYFSKNTEKSRNVAIRSYFVPYVLLTIATYVQIIVLNGGQRVPFNIFSPAAGLWFLFVLTVYKILLPDVVRLRTPVMILAIVGLGAGFSHEFTTKFSLQRLMVFFFFFILGYKTSKKDTERIRNYSNYISFVITGIVILLSYGLNRVKNFKVTLLHGKLYYRDGLEGFDLAIRILFYIVGVAMIFVLIQLISTRRCVLTKIGKNSFPVYMIHLFIMRWMDQEMIHYNIQFKNEFIYIVIMIVLSTITVVLCSRDVVANCVNRVISLFNKLLFHESNEKGNGGF